MWCDSKLQMDEGFLPSLLRGVGYGHKSVRFDQRTFLRFWQD